MKDIIDEKCPGLLKNLCQIYADETHGPYSCILNKYDSKNNVNKCRIMQLLNRAGEAYFIYMRWGSIDAARKETIDCYLQLDQALAAFYQHFHQLTGKAWDQRTTDQSVLPDKYHFILMTYNITEPETLPNYMVDPAVEPLIHRIFDMNLCKDVQIDLTKCPLGMLSLTQINKAYTILTEMLNPSVQVNYEELTEHYYNTIPTRKGHMGLINTREKIQEKLDFLTELENIHHISKHDKLSIQTKYLSLQADVRPVDTETRSLIEQYLGTNSGYHNMKLKFVEAFEINKPAEAHSFRRWETLHNKHLLWHGTAMSNVAGILTNGLCLNPSIPVAITGKMFGSGLYFANVSTKSAGYLRITSGIGAMFLCEVALGNMLELKNAQQVTLPSGKHSVRGMGHFTPDTETFLNRWDDVTVPIGKLIISDDPGVTLQYDEFIVYDQTQVRLRYLVLIDLKN